MIANKNKNFEKTHASCSNTRKIAPRSQVSRLATVSQQHSGCGFRTTRPSCLAKFLKRDHFVGIPINRYLCLLIAGFKLRQNDLDENPVRTYHRIIEAFKFAYKYRSMLADPDYEKEVNKVCSHNGILSFYVGLLVRGNVC